MKKILTTANTKKLRNLALPEKMPRTRIKIRLSSVFFRCLNFLCFKSFQLAFLFLVLPSISVQALSTEGEKRMFTVTGYYSPLPNQNFYVTGSYEGDIRLNGHGVRGADGTPVFPGMIAAPSSYRFGTKVCLPNFGCGQVHDRGGAIVEKGGRNIARHDRLDLWLGYGEEGLARALELGLWHTEGTIYAAGAPVEVAVNFKAATPISKILDLPIIREFSENLYAGNNGEAVKELQQALQDLSHYDGEIDGVYSEAVRLAVLEFQLDNFVVESASSQGAGGFGPKTRESLSRTLHDFETQQRLAEKWVGFEFDKNMARGKRDIAVIKLQEILVQQEFLDHAPTGYFGKLTEKALTEFQIANGIVQSAHANGAGNLGPKTREYLNQVLEVDEHFFALDEGALQAYVNQSQKLRFMLDKSDRLIVKN